MQSLSARLPETLSAAASGWPSVRIVIPDRSEDVAAVDPTTLARRIGANAVLVGSIAQAGVSARVTWQLLLPDRHMQWAGDVITGTVMSPFDLEDDVVKSFKSALGVRNAPSDLLPGRRPSDPAAAERYELAMRYLPRHDLAASVEAAIGQFERPLASEGEQARLLAGLARAFAHKGRLTHERVWEARAATAVERAAGLDAACIEVQLALGEVQWASDRHEAAVEHYGRAIKAHPECVDAWIGRARSLALLGKPIEAERDCRRAIELASSDWRAWNVLGRIHYERGDYAHAADAWSRVVELVPDHAAGCSNLGTAFLNQDRLEDAIETFRRSVAIRPTPYGYHNLGTALYYASRFEEAVSSFEKAVALNPSDAIGWGNLGDACRWIPERVERAKEALEEAIRLTRDALNRNPGRADDWARLGNHLSNLDRHADAEAALAEARRLSPDDPQVLVMSGHASFLAGDRVAALSYFQKAVLLGFGTRLLRLTPGLAAIRDEPDFRRILESRPAKSGN